MKERIRQFYVLLITGALLGVVYWAYLTPNDLAPFSRWLSLTGALIVWAVALMLLTA